MDTESPVVTAPADMTVETTDTQTTVDIGSATATDNVGVVSLTNDAPSTFPVGTTTITWTATDAAGNIGNATQKVTVQRITEVELGKFYTVAITGTGTNRTQKLVSIDPETANVETVLPIQGELRFGSNTLAISPDGEFYGWGLSEKQLIKIDLTTGQISKVGSPTEYRQIWGMAFDWEGKLYGLQANTNSLLSIDPDTSAVTEIGNLGVDIYTNGLAIDFDTDELYAVTGIGKNQKDKILKINKNTGKATEVGSYGMERIAVGTEFNPLTGELFAVRSYTNLLKINLDTGEVTTIGTLGEGVSTVSLASPWPEEKPIDTEPPVVIPPEDKTVEATGPQTAVDIGSATATDNVGVVSLTNDAPSTFPVGTTTITWSATDAAGNVGNDTQNVKVQDTTPPEINLTLIPDSLWPPNHKMVDIVADVIVNDAVDDSPEIVLTYIFSDEKDNSEGDGNTEEDIQDAKIGTEDYTFSLRAERNGNSTVAHTPLSIM